MTRYYQPYYYNNYIPNWSAPTCNNSDHIVLGGYVGTSASTTLGNFHTQLNATSNSTITYQQLYQQYAFTDLTGLPQRQLETPEQKARLQVIAQKADRLLFAHLSAAQRETFERAQYFDVVSSRGRTYRIKKFRSGNVFLLDAQGREVRKYCAYANDPGGSLPDGDYFFTQMMTLQYDELAFLKMANTWDLLQPHKPFVGQGVDYDVPLPIAEAA